MLHHLEGRARYSVKWPIHGVVVGGAQALKELWKEEEEEEQALLANNKEELEALATGDERLVLL